MAFVFGGTLICADKETANKVTYDKNILVKSITIDGDVYDPSGTLTGGAAPKNGGVLIQVQEIKAVEVELRACRKELEEVTGKLTDAKAVIDKFRKAKRELEIKEHQVGLLEEQVNGSNAARVSSFPSSPTFALPFPFSVNEQTDPSFVVPSLLPRFSFDASKQIIAEVAAIKANIAELKEAIAGTKYKQKQAKDDVKRLEKEMNDFKNNKDSKLAELKVRRLLPSFRFPLSILPTADTKFARRSLLISRPPSLPRRRLSSNTPLR